MKTRLLKNINNNSNKGNKKNNPVTLDFNYLNGVSLTKIKIFMVYVRLSNCILL